MKCVVVIRSILFGIIAYTVIYAVLFLGMTIGFSPDTGRYKGDGRIINIGTPILFGISFLPGYKIILDSFNYCEPRKNKYTISALPEFGKNIYIQLEGDSDSFLNVIKQASISVRFSSAHYNIDFDNWDMHTSEGIENIVYVYYPTNAAINPKQAIPPIDVTLIYNPKPTSSQYKCGYAKLVLKSGGDI